MRNNKEPCGLQLRFGADEWPAFLTRTIWVMGANSTGNPQPSVTTEDLLAAAGIEVTEEGKRRARVKLDAAQAWYAEHGQELRQQLGWPPADAA